MCKCICIEANILTIKNGLQENADVSGTDSDSDDVVARADYVCVCM